MLRQNNSQAGFTLVELMISMVISSIIIFFLFSIQTRMGRAYQGQGTVSEINQNLQSAKQFLLTELRMAGFGLGGSGNVAVSDAIEDAATPNTAGGFLVSNNAYGDGNDSFRIFSTDLSVSIQVSPFDDTPPGIRTGQVFADTVVPATGLATGEPIVLTTRSAACLLVVTGVNSVKVTFNPSGAPYNQAPKNPHCDAVIAAFEAGEPASIQRFSARSYRIDPNRTDEGYLQVHPSGEVGTEDWEDLGVGFTNLQIATRYFEAGDTDDLDQDGDPERDWYSGDNQANDGSVGAPPSGAVLIQASISIEARSPHGTRGAAASSTTPAYVSSDLTLRDNNSIGDWGDDCTGAPTDPCGVHLSATPDASRPDRYKGEFIYRSTTSIVDLRNMGVGQ